MSLKVTTTSLPGLLLIEPEVFGDCRGFFMETYQAEKYAALGLDQVFVQDNYSRSRQGTVRGLHYQLKHPQGKLIQVLSGRAYDVAVDIRRNSPTFGQWAGFILAAEDRRQLYVPPGFAHGFAVLSETVDFFYKCTDFYHPEDEHGISWLDPQIGIDWPVLGTPLLSDKDRQNPRLSQLQDDLLPSCS